MALSSKTLQIKAFLAISRPTAACRPKLLTRCQARNEASARREVLMGGAAVAAASLLMQSGSAVAATRQMAVSSLSTFQRGAQRKAFQAAAEKVLKEKFGKDDANKLLTLILHDAATYDVNTTTGGFDGSILLNSEELDRPENSYLKPLANRLLDAKKAVDAAVPAGSGPISHADLMTLAAKVATEASWRAEKLKRVQTASGGEIITTVYGAEWPVRLGRLDSAEAPPAGRLPADDAPVKEIVAYMKQLGVKGGAAPGLFAPKAPFWERPTFVIWPAASKDPAATEQRFVTEDPANFAGPKRDFDRSKATLTRTGLLRHLALCI
eukprot:GHRR01011867.1.p1 GENE.GHRR01011867.1~~GHRR01011867.1.p1  ORF type:complete len:324 (+),score=114.29 GHRR01011867.1:58-1029(+)